VVPSFLGPKGTRILLHSALKDVRAGLMVKRLEKAEGKLRSAQSAPVVFGGTTSSANPAELFVMGVLYLRLLNPTNILGVFVESTLEK
jgi:hypothetical protein